jgi:AcrR family transcriptional regulator
MSTGAKPTAQQRSRLKRDEIVAALDRLLVGRAFAEISIQDIARDAGVSAATIYQRFSNKDAAASILVELYIMKVREWDEAHKDNAAIEAAGTLHGALRAVGEDAWRQFDTLAYVMRPAYLVSRQRPDLLGEQWLQMERSALAGFSRLLDGFKGEFGEADIKRHADAIACFYNMMLLGKLLHADSMGVWIGTESPKKFGEVLADFAVGFLLQQTRAARSEKQDAS